MNESCWTDIVNAALIGCLASAEMVYMEKCFVIVTEAPWGLLRTFSPLMGNIQKNLFYSRDCHCCDGV